MLQRQPSRSEKDGWPSGKKEINGLKQCEQLIIKL